VTTTARGLALTGTSGGSIRGTVGRQDGRTAVRHVIREMRRPGSKAWWRTRVFFAVIADGCHSPFGKPGECPLLQIHLRL